jgi:ATP-dependent protease ClpP protease subunit
MNHLGPFVDHNARVVSLLGRVGHAEIDALGDQLLRLDTARRKPITLYLSCQGGTVLDALKITDIFACVRSKVTAIGMGLVEGAGVIILACAAERILLPSAILSTAGLHQFETRQASSLVAAIEPRIADLRNRAEQLPEMIRAASRDFRFFTASEAQKLELIDKIYSPTQIPYLTTKHAPYVIR